MNCIIMAHNTIGESGTALIQCRILRQKLGALMPNIDFKVSQNIQPWQDSQLKKIGLFPRR